jgi:four helix bundle protein
MKEESRIQNPEPRIQRAPAKNFEDLIVWQKSHQLTLLIYRITSSFPPSEIYGIVTQIRRASSSVSANIAEAFKKRSKADKARILNIAQGSLEETRYFLILSRDLRYSTSTESMALLEEVSRLLEAYTRTILNSSY